MRSDEHAPASPGRPRLQSRLFGIAAEIPLTANDLRISTQRNEVQKNTPIGLSKLFRSTPFAYDDLKGLNYFLVEIHETEKDLWIVRWALTVTKYPTNDQRGHSHVAQSVAHDSYGSFGKSGS
jgi:hypothetical protein